MTNRKLGALSTVLAVLLFATGPFAFAQDDAPAPDPTPVAEDIGSGTGDQSVLPDASPQPVQDVLQGAPADAPVLNGDNVDPPAPAADPVASPDPTVSPDFVGPVQPSSDPVSIDPVTPDVTAPVDPPTPAAEPAAETPADPLNDPTVTALAAEPAPANPDPTATPSGDAPSDATASPAATDPNAPDAAAAVAAAAPAAAPAAEGTGALTATELRDWASRNGYKYVEGTGPGLAGPEKWVNENGGVLKLKEPSPGVPGSEVNRFSVTDANGGKYLEITKDATSGEVGVGQAGTRAAYGHQALEFDGQVGQAASRTAQAGTAVAETAAATEAGLIGRAAGLATRVGGRFLGPIGIAMMVSDVMFGTLAPPSMDEAPPWARVPAPPAR